MTTKKKKTPKKEVPLPPDAAFVAISEVILSMTYQEVRAFGVELQEKREGSDDMSDALYYWAVDYS